MAKKKGANSKAIPMVGSSLGSNVKQPAPTPPGFKGKKIGGSAKASVGGKTTLRTTSGNKSSVVNPPRGGGY